MISRFRLNLLHNHCWKEILYNRTTSVLPSLLLRRNKYLCYIQTSDLHFLKHHHCFLPSVAHNYCYISIGDDPSIEDSILDDDAERNNLIETYNINNEVYTEQLPFLRSSYNKIVDFITENFDITMPQILSIIDNEKLHCIPNYIILDTLRVLHSYGVSGEQLLQHSEILEKDSEYLNNRLPLLQQPDVFDSVNDGLIFCFCDEETLKGLQKLFHAEKTTLSPHKNRIYYIAHSLDKSTHDISDLIYTRYWKTLQHPLSGLMKNCELLQENIDHLSLQICSSIMCMSHQQAINKVKRIRKKQLKKLDKTASSKLKECDAINYLKQLLKCGEEHLIFASSSSRDVISSMQPRAIYEQVSLMKKYGISDEAMRNNLLFLHIEIVTLEDILLDYRKEKTTLNLTDYILYKMHLV